MSCRRPGGKPTLALWMLVAVADVALLAAAVGVAPMMLSVVALALVAGSLLAARSLARRTQSVTDVAVRRRA
jgi:hypothetical protein